MRLHAPPQEEDERQHADEQNTPMPIWVARQPVVAMKCCTTGGQIVPAR